MRSLGRFGVQLYSVESGSQSFASFSRYCNRRFRSRDGALNMDSLDVLLEIGRSIGQRAILIATTDESAIFLANYAKELREWFIFPENPPDIVQSLCSKKEMFFIAKKLGLPTPCASFPRCRAEVVRFSEETAFPVMIKGIDGHRLSQHAGKRMFLAHTKADLLERYDSAEDHDNPNLMLQEYIPGSDESVCGVEAYFDQNSECRFAISGQKLRQWPAYKGVTTLGVCRTNPSIESITKAFARKIGYKGILDIGFRYDSRDGQWKVLDINPRIGSTFRLFVCKNGIDAARALYLDLTGQEVITDEPQEGRKWMVEDLDLLSSLRYLWDGKLGARVWMSSFRGLRECAYFASDDPLPLFAMGLNRAAMLMAKCYRKIMGNHFAPLRKPSSAGRWA